MKRLLSLLPAMLLVLFVACGGDDDNPYNLGGKTSGKVDTDPGQTDGPEIAKTNLEFPLLKGGKSVVIVHYAPIGKNSKAVNYCVEWDTEKGAQRWSCYQMYAESNIQTVQRYDKSHDVDKTLSYSTGQYPNDPDLDQSYRFSSDPYWSSGFDHGHICPSQDRVCSEEANHQTFVLTNMQPQYNAFNAGIWANMEAQVRKWANKFDVLYVCKGGTIDKAANIIEYVNGKSHQSTRVNKNYIPVPKYFFMAVLGQKGSTYKATGFWIAQDSYKSQSMKSYSCNIQTLEKNTGINFFCNLPDDIENQVETVSKSQMEQEWAWDS